MSIIKLSKPIKVHDKEVDSIELCEPTTADVMHCGYPLTIGDGTATPKADAIGALIARLAGIPPSSVKQMALQDFSKAMGEILSFFGQSEESTEKSKPT